MYKFNLRAQSLTLVSSNETQTTYQAVVNLKDLVNANDTIGKDLYEANVRGTLFTGKTPDKKNPTYSGISKTLIDIYNDNSLLQKFDRIRFYLISVDYYYMNLFLVHLLYI